MGVMGTTSGRCSMVDWQIGQVILNEYMIERELGRGGMGRVWLVKSNSTGRCFAVKQTLLKDEKHRKAFLGELQTWIDLPEHPNIVPCRFFRTVGDEIVIFADYIEGGSLADWITKGKLTSLEQILDVAIQFAWGLHSIHDCGLVHQDIKPGNVLMTVDGVPMVTDFGLARARSAEAGDQEVVPSEALESQGFAVSYKGMTLAYVSPEQYTHSALTRKTDVWSLGVSILEMFIGEVLWKSGVLAMDVLGQYVEGQLLCRDNLPKMPLSVVDLLTRVFSREPSERPSCGELIQALSPCYREIVGCPHPSSNIARSAVSRTIEREAIRNLKHVTSYDVDSEILLDRARLMEEANDNPGALAEYTRCIDACLKNTAHRTSVYDRVILGTAYNARARLFMRSGDGESAHAGFSDALSIARGLLDACRPNEKRMVTGLFVVVNLNFSALLMELGAWREAIGVLGDDCLPVLEGVVNSGHVYMFAELFMIMNNLVTGYIEVGDLGNAMRISDRALSYAQKLPLTTHTDMATAAKVQGVRADILMKLSENGCAEICLSKAIADLGECVRRWGDYESVTDLGEAMLAKAGLLWRLEDYSKTSEQYQLVIEYYLWCINERGFQLLRGDLAWARIASFLLASVNGRVQWTPKELKQFQEAVVLAQKAVSEDLRSDIADVLRRNEDGIKVILAAAEVLCNG